jgi:mRNA interferase RelE/StbE
VAFAFIIDGLAETRVSNPTSSAIRQSPTSGSQPDSIHNLKKLRAASGSYYRIRIGEYRIGLIFSGGIVTFVRCLHRKEIYRYFP